MEFLNIHGLGLELHRRQADGLPDHVGWTFLICAGSVCIHMESVGSASLSVELDLLLIGGHEDEVMISQLSLDSRSNIVVESHAITWLNEADSISHDSLLLQFCSLPSSKSSSAKMNL